MSSLSVLYFVSVYVCVFAYAGGTHVCGETCMWWRSKREIKAIECGMDHFPSHILRKPQFANTANLANQRLMETTDDSVS